VAAIGRDMRALIVYESMFGNTRDIARAIGEGLTTHGVEATVIEVGAAPAVPEAGLDLLVVGGPTHVFGLSRRTTRASAADQATGAIVSTGTGLREWLDDLPEGARSWAVAFDTHVARKVPGSAARAAERRLRRRGYPIAAPAESFHVTDVEGPLVEGEEDRARRWGAALATASGADAVTAPLG
jgi:hypothetical protein